MDGARRQGGHLGMVMSDFISSTLVTSKKVTGHLASRLGQEGESSSSGGCTEQFTQASVRGVGSVQPVRG